MPSSVDEYETLLTEPASGSGATNGSGPFRGRRRCTEQTGATLRAVACGATDDNRSLSVCEFTRNYKFGRAGRSDGIGLRARYLFASRSARELKIIRQDAGTRFEMQGRSWEPGHHPPQRAQMKTEGEALIYHSKFKEGFSPAPGEVLLPLLNRRAGRMGWVHRQRRFAKPLRVPLAVVLLHQLQARRN